MKQADSKDGMKQQPDITVIVATHKPYRMPTDSMYLPLHVGAALHPEVTATIEGASPDNTGTHISDRNDFYSELTGLYWLWKNNRSNYKGLVHYRRHLGTRKNHSVSSKDPFDKILTKKEALELFQHTDILLAKRRNYYIETVASHYEHTLEKRHLDVCREIIQEQCPEYLGAWDKTMHSRGAHMFNMFIMKEELFDSYCAWMFPILFELEKRIDPKQYDAFHARFIGRVSEMLLDPWITTHGYSYVELPVVSPEPINWRKKITSFLMAKFFGKKYTKSF